MCSHKPPSLKPHNKAKTPFKNHFKNTALKPPSIKSTSTTIFHNLNRHNSKMCSCKNKLHNKAKTPFKNHLKKLRSNPPQ